MLVMSVWAQSKGYWDVSVAYAIQGEGLTTKQALLENGVQLSSIRYQTGTTAPCCDRNWPILQSFYTELRPSRASIPEVTYTWSGTMVQPKMCQLFQQDIKLHGHVIIVGGEEPHQITEHVCHISSH
ncbi:hypothetical protein DPEC_G00202250 [Dallia pectoralis]|uniref:Uncharacterized protein n=1 Tax=Dallia pectoralis TaxID=75939 RepID=A0ACC2G9N7_DALPE|nr:hypothetical protein DPEC_G00202250 [Dallia pectoralis]